MTSVSLPIRTRRRIRPGHILAHTLLIVWALLVIGPLLWSLLSSFKSTTEVLGSPFTLPAHWSFANYISAWNDSNFGRLLINTVVVVAISMVIVMVLGAMCAYVLARFRFFGNRVIYYLMLVGLTFPLFLAIVPLFSIMRSMTVTLPGGTTFTLLNSLPGLIVTYVAFALPFTVFFLHSFFRGLPDEIYEATKVDGASEWRTFFQVMLPMARQGMVSVSIFNFLGLWNQFILPAALNTNPQNWVLSQGMAAFVSQAGYQIDFGSLFAAVVITVLPVFIVYLIFQRQLQGSVSQGTSR